MKRNLDMKNTGYKNLQKICENIYKPEESGFVSLESVNPYKDLFKFARKNRLIHFLAQEYPDLFKINKKSSILYNNLINEFKDYKIELIKSIEKVKKIYDKEDFMVIKTISSYPHLTSDLDILAKQLKTIKQSLNTDMNSFSTDINTEIKWGKAHPISNQFAWGNTEEINFEGLDFLIPNANLDVFIRIAHLPFELAKFRLGELLYIYKKGQQVNWPLLDKESRKMGWQKTFQRMKKTIDKLHYCLFNIQYFHNLPLSLNKINKIIFPYNISSVILIKAVIEQKAWGKIWGGRFLLKDQMQEWIKRN